MRHHPGIRVLVVIVIYFSARISTIFKEAKFG